MSMLSAQIDELRQKADGQVTYRDAREVMLRAADTIFELRDCLQRTNAENARLRSELESVGTAAYLYGRGDLKAENAKLRELVAEMFNACPMCVNCAHNHLTVGWYDRMRELGVEVS